ncbi:sigma 54-interacting transcriptional regulator [Sporolactobacillus terrae]|uniref:sigma 54-interacting transcriptional regulator n=1 Tax=Sporolactobacillus terrae TaxID=269673 RepID=UPI000FE1698B|nr:sigma 54-interacting transcriptional regulator [Sporolactobacillus terrae]QAA24736.1 AAA family ATPase [Sporolactobacillus terrae]UAK16565.1 sigma 54-interacting transcriptional regulator [Sporolactobacillus terrae]
MKAQDRVYEALVHVGNDGVTAAQLAKKLELSRPVVSHYLNGLLKEERAAKKGTKPVYWTAIAERKMWPARQADAFQNFIGYDGSQKAVIEQCRAAVNYPPDGLPIIINGKSGVGKSFLAGLIYRYACDQGVIDADAPFIILNCADYANNPELLSSTLFGHKKGAFTGADQDKEGLLKQADGGYLFFDEIHRLSFENQEKLFVFMDKGHFRPIGENKQWHTSKVRLIFATTEQNDEVLLGTFRRRIPVKVHLRSFSARPFSERMQLIDNSYRQEAKKLGKDLFIQSDVVNQLCFQPMEGNIGMLRNLIQLSCAHAYTANRDQETLTIEQIHLPEADQGKNIPHVFHKKLPPMQVRHDGKEQNVWNDESSELTRHIDAFLQVPARERSQKEDDERSRLSLAFTKLVQAIVQLKQNNALFLDDSATVHAFFHEALRLICERYGLLVSKASKEAMYAAFLSLNDLQCSKEQLKESEKYLAQSFPKAHYVAEKFSEKTADIMGGQGKRLLTLLNTLFFHPAIKENIPLHGLIVAHGRQTASSIQAVANQLCKTFVFEAIDMPVSTDLSEIIEKVKHYLERQDTSEGLILLVDMGSLTRLYSSIKNELSGDLLVINNLTTAVALDVGMKMVQHVPFKKIAEQANSNYKINARYFEGLTQGKNMIISCMSGVGISNQVREIMAHFIPQDRLSILTMEYKELRDAIARNDRSYFKQTLFILTTSELPSTLDVPNLNIYEILEDKGKAYLWQVLRPFISQRHFDLMLQDFLKNFTIEGVSNRLSFLNPKVIINEVEQVISLYEKYYEIALDGKVKLNLYMHIALMIERLITTKDSRTRDPLNAQSEQEQEFMAVTKEIFHTMEAKYNIRVNGYELSLLYELLKPFINKK